MHPPVTGRGLGNQLTYARATSLTETTSAKGVTPLTILHLTAPASIGGLERVVAALAAGHARAGIAVHVAAVVQARRDADRFLGPLEAQGVVVHPVVVSARGYLRERAEIRALCRAIGPSIVHTHGYRADVATSGVARAMGIPTVTTVHGFTGGSVRNRLYETLQVISFRRFGAVVAVSRPLQALLQRRGVPSNRLRLIVNAFSAAGNVLTRDDARARLGLPAAAFCVGWLGRLTHEKGADVLVDAIAALPDTTIVSFVGAGREQASLTARVAALGIASRVRWHGIVDDASAVLPAFDAFVLSSRTEGTPIALFEAMAAGVPIVATRVGGVPGVLRDEDALLVPSENAPALAAAVERIRIDGAAASARAAAALQRLRTTFALEPWLFAYESLYRELLTRSRGRM